MLTRRTFFKLTGASTIGWYAATRFGWVQRALAQIPGGTLDPTTVPKYQTPLLIPPVMPRAGTIMQRGRPVDYYEISMRQFSEQILPAGHPATTVWGYGAVAGKGGLVNFHNAPSLTIEAKWNRAVRVKWINDLKDESGHFRPHLLPVDPTLHWANPPQGSDPAYGSGPRDSRPTFKNKTPGPYTGPVPIVTHLHGSASVGDESDGFAEAWFLPAAGNIPSGYATEGTWYDYFAGKAQQRFDVTWGPGFATFQYPNSQRASTLWYHDHSLGMTRLNVYAGPAGFFLIREGPAGDQTVRDSRSGATAVLPGPAPKEGDPFPSNRTYYEIPIAIQDRSFNADGSLFYPDTRAFFDGFTGPYIPKRGSNVSPIWNPEFFGNMIIANGNTWPFQTVEKRRYRFRFLNGCQSRFLILDFNKIPGVEAWQIGNEGGFLAAPVNITEDHGNRLLMGLAERADVIVDFTNVPVGKYVLSNVGPDEPFGGGAPGVDFEPSDPESTGQILEFRVVPAVAADTTTPPQFLVLPAITPLPTERMTRPLALIELGSNVHDGPAEARLGKLEGDGFALEQMWADEISENPAVGDTEVWEFHNFTEDAHPMHIHEIAFEVVNRQGIEFVPADDDAGTPIRETGLSGDPRPAEPWESGFKDTVIAYPGEVTRLRARFENPGTFVWHCHIVEHEDNEMMRPYQIGPVQPGQPG